ncbi:LLM class flavin-dependent oxidoreductase [Streptomyces sp. NPDC002851]
MGERHARPFPSSSPVVLLDALAARISRIRLLTGVAVLAVLDPVRVVEEYATLDQLSKGRIELVIGKGAERATSLCSASTRASSGTTRPKSTSSCAASGARRRSPGRARFARP